MPDYDLGTARGKIEIDASGATAGVDEARKAAGNLDQDSKKAAESIGKAGLAIGGLGAIALGGFGLAIDKAADFEKGISAIGAVSGATEQQLEAIRKKALQIGADTKFSASEGAAAMEELAKAGIPLEGILSGAADATVALAAAGEIDLPEAATIAANAMNQFGLAAKDMPKIADLIAGAANASAIDVSDFGFALSQAGATANLVGLSFDDLSVAIAAMGNAGIKGSDAGTSLKTFLSNLQPTTDKQTALMQKLGLVTEDGANQFFDAAGKIKSMADISQTLQDALKGQTEQQKAATLEALFGSDAIRAAAIIADNGAKGFNDLATSMGKVKAADVAKQRMNNLSGSIEAFKGSVETAMIQVGTVLLPVLKSFTDKLASLVNKFGELSPGMQKFIVIGGVLAALFLTLVGGGLLMISMFLKARNTITEFKAAIQTLELAQKRQMIATKLQTAATFIATQATAAFNAVMALNPVILIVAALVALGVALFVLYKKFKPFRDLVDSIWQGIQKAFDVVMGVLGEFISWLKSNWDIVLTIIAGPFGLIILVVRRFGDDIVRIVGGAVKAVVDFFVKLPGRIMGFLSAALNAFIDFMRQLPERAAYFIGFLIGHWIKLHVDLIKLVIRIGIDIITAVVDFMKQLPGRVLGFLDLVWDNLYAFGVRFLNTAKQIGIDVLQAFVDFFTQLPGKVLGFLDSTWDKLYAFGVRAVTTAKEIGLSIINGVIDFIKSLPGKVIEFFTNAVNAMLAFVSSAKSKAGEVGKAAIDGFLDFFKDLPGKVKEILGDLVTKIKDAALGIFNGAKSLGSKVWDGFKKGLFGSPHTKVEYAVWDMLDNVKKGIGDLRGHMGTIEGLRADMAGADTTLALGTGAGVLRPAVGQGSAVAAGQQPGAANGVTIAELNINNPVGETSEQSLTRTMQKLEYAGYFG